MGAKSKIEWTDATWNPVRGCSLVNAGCTNCYAMARHIGTADISQNTIQTSEDETGFTHSKRKDGTEWRVEFEKINQGAM